MDIVALPFGHFRKVTTHPCGFAGHDWLVTVKLQYELDKIWNGIHRLMKKIGEA